MLELDHKKIGEYALGRSALADILRWIEVQHKRNEIAKAETHINEYMDQHYMFAGSSHKFADLHDRITEFLGHLNRTLCCYHTCLFL